MSASGSSNEVKSNQSKHVQFTGNTDFLAFMPNNNSRSYYSQFADALQRKFEHCDLLRELEPGSTINILDLACGIAEPIIPLVCMALQKGVKFHYIGVDIDERIISDNATVFKKLNGFMQHQKMGKISFIAGDLTRYKTLPHIGTQAGQFNLILYRQPNVLGEFEVFRQINESIAYFLNPNSGRLFFSCYLIDEMELLSKMLNLQLPSSGLDRHGYWPSRACKADDSFQIARKDSGGTILYSPDCLYVTYTPRHIIAQFNSPKISRSQCGFWSKTVAVVGVAAAVSATAIAALMR